MSIPLCFIFIISIGTIFSLTDGIQLIIANNCKEAIWPGILGNSGQETPRDGGFHLCSGEQTAIEVPENWSGRIWGRQGCCFDNNLNGSCQTGDCGGQLTCRGLGGAPPATLVQMTLGTSTSNLHYYDVSLVDGFNLPVSVAPCGGSCGKCEVAACGADLNVLCPSSLAVRNGGKVVGCKSACLAARNDRYCCMGEFGSARKCKPTIFGHIFKAICPQAYSYPFDDFSGLKTCRSNQYIITFCPSN